MRLFITTATSNIVIALVLVTKRVIIVLPRFLYLFRGLGEPHKLGFINNFGRGYPAVAVTVSIAQPYIAQMVFVLVHVKVRIIFMLHIAFELRKKLQYVVQVLEHSERYIDNEQSEFSNNQSAIGAEPSGLLDILENMGSLLPQPQAEDYEEREFERQMKKKMKRRRLN